MLEQAITVGLSLSGAFETAMIVHISDSTTSNDRWIITSGS
jgi:hypothetical protein